MQLICYDNNKIMLMIILIRSGLMQNKDFSHTQKFSAVEKNIKNEIRDNIGLVFNALKQKGYNPTNQIVGYILSGDPTYITAHNNARKMINKFERDEILEEIVNFYLAQNKF